MTLFNEYVRFAPAIIITTDLEPDDLVALHILKDYLPDVPLLFLVGEGNAYIKYMRMKVYAELLGLTNYKIIQGESSDKDFKYDGYDVFNKEIIPYLRAQKNPEQNNYELLEFIKLYKPVIISLKPPRELYALYLKDGKLFNEIDIIGYMSFNIRCMLVSGDFDVIKFFESFKTVIYYESFLATGEENSINLGASVDETSSGFPFDKLPSYIIKLMQLWNKDISTYCQNYIKDFLDKDDEQSKEKIRRNTKTINNIKETNGVQFVNADCGLIASLLMDDVSQHCYYGFLKYDKNNYSVPIKNDKGNFIFVDPIASCGYRIKMMEWYTNNIKRGLITYNNTIII
jgi:hypothetical protein